jgi:hypothetical protein
MAAYQPYQLICCQNIDCIYTDKHRKPILVVLAKHDCFLMMVPA